MAYGRILVAIDFSEPVSSLVIEKAAGLAKCMGAEVCLLNVVEKEIPILMAKGFLVPSPDRRVIEKAFNKVKEESVKRLEEMAREVAGKWGIKVLPLVEVGVPTEVILNTAQKIEADLIVVGSHGKGGIEKFFLGSVSERVAMKAKVDVLIVRAQHE